MPITHFSSRSSSRHYFHSTQSMKITSSSSSSSSSSFCPTAGHLPGAAQVHPFSPAMLGGSATERTKLQTEACYCPQDQETEQMFEKPLTPSDVGKLNRLVIPKQHAEKYFPLDCIVGVDSVDKGLLLSFEDESGKSWRFRYSYWNSSQSYVLTKGWSRFVKEKQLDAGDIVSFQRRRVDRQRFFIRWRRGSTSTVPAPVTFSSFSPSTTWSQVYFSSVPYPAHHLIHRPPLHDSHDYIHAGVAAEPVIEKEEIRGNWKRLRLFGVNLECHQLDESGGQGGSSPLLPSLSSPGETHLLYPPHGSSHA